MHHVLEVASCALLLALGTFTGVLAEGAATGEPGEEPGREPVGLEGTRSLQDSPDKRDWSQLHSSWGKKSDLPRDSDLEADGSRVEKRESDAWDSLAGAWSKKNWNSLGPAWGKRSDWRKLDGMWGKRSDWRKLGGMWGKRAGGQQWRDRSTKYWDSYGNEDGSDDYWASKRTRWHNLSAMWGKRGLASPKNPLASAEGGLVEDDDWGSE